MTQLMKKDVSSSIGSITLLLTFINLLCNVDILYFNALAIYGLDIFFCMYHFQLDYKTMFYLFLFIIVSSCWQLFFDSFFAKQNVDRPSTVACSNFTIGSA